MQAFCAWSYHCIQPRFQKRFVRMFFEFSDYIVDSNFLFLRWNFNFRRHVSLSSEIMGWPLFWIIQCFNQKPTSCHDLPYCASNTTPRPHLQRMFISVSVKSNRINNAKYLSIAISITILLHSQPVMMLYSLPMK